MGLLHAASVFLVSAAPLLTSAYTEGDFYIFKQAENTTSLATAWYEHAPKPTAAARVSDGVSWHGNPRFVPEDYDELCVSLLEPQALLDIATVSGDDAEPTVFFAKPTVEIIIHGAAYVEGTNGTTSYRIGEEDRTMYYTSPGYLTSHSPTAIATTGTHQVEYSWTTTTEVTTTGTSTVEHTSTLTISTHVVENSHTTTTTALVTATSTNSSTLVVGSTTTHTEHTTTTSISGTSTHTTNSTVTQQTTTTTTSQVKRDVVAGSKEATYEVTALIKSAGTSLTATITVVPAVDSLVSYNQYDTRRGDVVLTIPRDTITKTETTTIYDHSETELTTKTSTLVLTKADTVTFIHPTTNTIHASTVYQHETTTTTTRHSIVTEKPKPTSNAAVALGAPLWLKLRKQERKAVSVDPAVVVRAQVLAHNSSENMMMSVAYPRIAARSAALVARETLPNNGEIVCSERKELPWAERVVQGINYLHDIKKDITLDACVPQGQSLGIPSTKRLRTCIWHEPISSLGDLSDLFNCELSRVSCSYNTAIFLVNCNMEQAVNTTSTFIAEKASEILSSCCFGRAGTDYCDNERLDSKLGMISGGIWKNEADKWYVDVRQTEGLGENC